MYGGTNLVPDTDILGHPIVNDIRDIGSWECDSNGGVDAVLSNAKKLNYNAVDCVATVSETARVINVYDFTGSLVAHVVNTDNISLRSLTKGAYVVVAIVNGESVIAKILR